MGAAEMTIQVERADGAVAWVTMPDPEPDGDDIWGPLEAAFPRSYDLIDEGMIVPGYVARMRPDAVFRAPGDDEALASWIMEGSE